MSYLIIKKGFTNLFIKSYYSLTVTKPYKNTIIDL